MNDILKEAMAAVGGEMAQVQDEERARYHRGLTQPPQDLAKACQGLIDRHTAALRGVITDIGTKQLEAQRVQAKIDVLNDQREKIERELAGARAAMVAMNSGDV
jgi:formate-dependent nitrite reductase cytochrome c552 subunit